jgi:hypothetical protein
MINGRTISIGRVIEGIYRDSAFAEHLDTNDAIEWSYELLKLLNIDALYVRKTECLDIQDYSAELPCDCYKLANVRNFSDGITMPENTNISYTPDCDGNVSKFSGGYGYKINGDRIYTTFEEGKIYIDYDAVASDEDGMPIIKEDAKLIDALKAYVNEKVARKLYHKGKITRAIMDDVKQESHFAVAMCQSGAAVPDFGSMQSLYNIWVRLSPNNTANRTGMQFANYPERLRNFNNRK